MKTLAIIAAIALTSCGRLIFTGDYEVFYLRSNHEIGVETESDDKDYRSMEDSQESGDLIHAGSK